MTTPDPLKLARDALPALPQPALWLAWNTSYTGIRFWTADAAVAESQAATGLALTGFYSAEQMRAAIDAMPASVQADLADRLQAALAMPACDRLREWVAIGPVQRAAVESLAELLTQASVPSAQAAPAPAAVPAETRFSDWWQIHGTRWKHVASRSVAWAAWQAGAAQEAPAVAAPDTGAPQHRPRNCGGACAPGCCVRPNVAIKPRRQASA